MRASELQSTPSLFRLRNMAIVFAGLVLLEPRPNTVGKALRRKAPGA
jgi:hypothetical protein